MDTQKHSGIKIHLDIDVNTEKIDIAIEKAAKLKSILLEIRELAVQEGS